MDEAFAVVAQSARKLFSASTGGTVFVFGPSREALEATATWGEGFASEPVISPTDCWALRRGGPLLGGQPPGGQVWPRLQQHLAGRDLFRPFGAPTRVVQVFLL